MNNLSQDWEWATIGSVAESFVDGPFGSNLKTEHYQPTGVRVIRLQNIADGFFDDSDKAYISEEHANKLRRHEARSGDVLIASMGAVLPRVCLVPPNIGQAIVKADCFRLRPRMEMLPGYISYMLSAPQTRKHASTQIAGVGRPRLNLKKISALEIPVPSRENQERIVAAIEEQFSRLQAGAAALRSARRRSSQMRSAVLEDAIKGRLAGNICMWSVSSLSEIADVTGGITKNPKRLPRSNSFPFLRVANVLRDKLDLSEIHQVELFSGDLERYRLERGDLLIVEGNGSSDQIGRSALWDGSIDSCVHQNHLIRARPLKGVMPEYLNIFWNAPSTRARLRAVASSTSGLHTLSAGKVRRIEVTLPPMRQQQRIVEEVERQLSAIEYIDHILDAIDSRSYALQQGILSAAFSGKLI